MSEQAKTRIELRCAIALMLVAGLALVGVAGLADMPDPAVAARTVAGMSPTELLALVALLAIGLCGYLIRLLFGRLLNALDQYSKAQSEVARLLSERPCIRRSAND